MLQVVSALYWVLTELNPQAGKQEPIPVVEGMLAYADGTNWNPGNGRGLYRRVSGAWVFLADGGNADRLDGYHAADLIALADSYGAGNIEIYSNTREDSTTASSYVKVKEVIVGLGGTLRIDFQLKIGNSLQIAYGKIYRNGTAVGTERSTSSTTYVNFSEDIGGWSSGDFCQLYIRTSFTAAAYTNNLYLRADKSFTLRQTL